LGWLSVDLYHFVGDDLTGCEPSKLKRRLDINAENKSHLVHDTKYSSKATGTAATAPTAAAPAHELIRYVWLSDGAATDGTGGLN